MPRTSSPFITIHAEGALLPPELLARVADADKDLGGLISTDYHLGENERVTEAISRSWNRLVGVWASFESSLEGLSSNDPGTGVTRERWLAPVFQELGFGRLQVAKAREIEGTDYPISHEWSEVPIHLVGAGVELERRTKGVAGAARMSPHALVQDYLNRTEALWGIVSNGRELRLLRDNVSLTRQAYLAFDLEAMFAGEVYADFAILWLTCHQSRFEPHEDKATECWLERWTQAAQTQGTRALNTLRDGVEVAISMLGAGFVAHPANAPLREALRSGELATSDYYRELLRLIYRLIFLFVAEDRALLHPDASAEEARTRYRDFYSMTHMRHLAERLRGGPHPDLWRSFVFVCAKLAEDEGCEELGLPFLGSSLFSPDACPHLDAAELANRDLLGAVRALAFTEQRKVLRQIDYRNMGSEELGSIYESLLELHPEVHHESGTFSLATAAGNERKTTGSYYTPTSLISALLDTALDPVIDEAASKSEAAILDVKVLDPACGSGHFLVAAAHRIAKRLAAHRTDEPEPSPGAYRAALREVISRSIFGIDVNPMAVELCKVSLWMEAVEPGKPLSFLEHHIVCGNSLLGTTPALLANGIPDEAFTALEGDDKETVKSLKARNKQERKGQASLFGEAAHPDLISPIASKIAALDASPDDSPEALHAKQQAWEALAGSDQLAHAKLIADAWCASFVIEKTPDSPVLTQGVLELLERNPIGGDPKLHQTIHELSTTYRFLHPHLAFPQVFHIPEDGEAPDDPDQGWSGGFDVIVGNPPWDTVELQERQWFSSRRPEIASAKTASERKRAIHRLEQEDPVLSAEWHDALREADGTRSLLANSNRFPLCGRGRVNTYAVFAEVMSGGVAATGRVGAVLPLGIATDTITSPFFRQLVERASLEAFYGFENERFIFEGIDHRVTFGLLVFNGGGRQANAPQLCFFARQPADIGDGSRVFTLTPKDFSLLSPQTGTCPIFRSPRDAELTKGVYSRIPVLGRAKDGTEWACRMKQGLFNMASDSSLFRTREALIDEGWMLEGRIFVRGDERQAPLFEAKMVNYFDHRFGTFVGQSESQAKLGTLPAATDNQHSDPSYVGLPRYWTSIQEAENRIPREWRRDWLLGWRDVTNVTNARTLIPAFIPRVGVGHGLPLLFPSQDARIAACLLANLSSFCLDYLARQRVSGTHLTFAILQQLPTLPPSAYGQAAPWDHSTSLVDWISKRVLELVYTSWDLTGLALELGHDGAPFRWKAERRALLRAELDAAYFHLYGIGRDDADYIMETFPIVRRNDEKTFGDYQTKRLILQAYESVAKAAKDRQTYETMLDLPPADLRMTS